MSEQNETIDVKTSLPPGPAYLPELNSPVLDPSARIINQDTRQPSAQETSRLTPEERARRKAMIVTALERGVINDRMKVELPPELHGEWVRRDAFEIEQMRRLGFEIDTKYATSRALNTDGTGAAFVADVVHMITPRENKELIDEVKHEKFLEMHSKKGKDKEEKEYASGVRAETSGIIPTDLESRTREARKEDISAALQAMDAQTKPQV